MSSEPTDWYAPNQQAVRGDESGPAEEGEGGTTPAEAAPPEPQAEPGSYEALTKAELIELAQERGISPANNDMTKAELIEALEAG